MQGMCEKTMSKKEFLKLIVSKMEFIGLRDGTELTIKIEQENHNGVIKDGILLISKKDNYALFCSLPEFEENQFDVECAEENAGRVAKAVLGIFENNNTNGKNATEALKTWENAQEALLPVLYSRETFKKMNVDCPHRYFFDLVICYQLFAERISEIKGTIFITNEMAEEFAVNEEVLFQKAMENMKKATFVDSVSKTRISKRRCNHDCCMGCDGETAELYVIRCNAKYGDGALLNAQRLNELAKEIGTKRLAIIPSSLHECLLVDGENIDVSALRELVRYNNKTKVSEEDILSYSLYFYDVKKGYGIYEKGE